MGAFVRQTAARAATAKHVAAFMTGDVSSNRSSNCLSLSSKYYGLKYKNTRLLVMLAQHTQRAESLREMQTMIV
jgi:hypothetical protein